MELIDTGDPDILQTRKGGGVMMVFGVPFLLTGLFLFGYCFWGPSAESGGPPWFVLASFGAGFTAIGLPLTFGRSGIIIDRKKQYIVRWSGLLVPMKKTTYSLGSYNRITIRKVLNRNEDRSYYVYPIELKRKDNPKEDIFFDEPSDFLQARNIAEKITTFLKLQLVDSTSGTEVIRESGKLDESIRERTKRTGERVATFSPPPGLSAKVREQSDRLIVEITPEKLTSEHVKQMAVFLIIGVVIACVFIGVKNLRHLQPHQFIVYVPVGIFILLFSSRSLLSRARRSWLITASRDSLRVENRASKQRIVTEIPVAELEDFVMVNTEPKTPRGGYQSKNVRGFVHNPGAYSGQQPTAGTNLLAKLFPTGPGPSITASSDEATVNFGKGLREDELRYLYALIKKKITA
jgi:hypothetical protein